MSDPVRKEINRVGGKGTAEVYVLLIKFSPVGPTAEWLAKETGLSVRTVKRRLAWLRAKENGEVLDRIFREAHKAGEETVWSLSGVEPSLSCL
jgi:hypothetical protein